MSRAVLDPRETGTISLLINSADRVNPRSLPNQCEIKFPRNIPNVWQVELSSFICLNSFYAIDTTKDIIPITEGTTTTYVVIPSGTYSTGASFATQLETTLNAAGLTNTYTVSFSDTTLELTISATGAFSVPWASAYALEKPIASRQLGFGLPSAAVNVTASGSPAAVTSTGPLQVYNQNNLGIQFSFNLNNGLATSQCCYTFCIPVDVPYGELISYRRGVRSDEAFLSLQGMELGKRFSVSLVDPESGLLVTNPSEWNCQLRVTPMLGTS